MDNGQLLSYFTQMFNIIVWVMGLGFTIVGAVGGIKIYRDSNREDMMLKKLTENMNKNWGAILDTYIANQDRMVSERLLEWGKLLQTTKQGLCKRADDTEKVILQLADITGKNTEKINDLAETLARHIEDGIERENKHR